MKLARIKLLTKKEKLLTKKEMKNKLYEIIQVTIASLLFGVYVSIFGSIIIFVIWALKNLWKFLGL